jgi:hypothetical protein
MRRFHLPRAAILARIAGLGENFISPGNRGGLLGIGGVMDYYFENGNWRRRRLGCFHKFRFY